MPPAVELSITETGATLSAVAQQGKAIATWSDALMDLFIPLPGAINCSHTIPYMAGRRKGTVDIEICIRRTDEEAGAAAAPQKSFYRLVAGTPHDNVLLLHETLVLEQFPSPLTFRSTVQKPQGEHPGPHLAMCSFNTASAN